MAMKEGYDVLKEGNESVMRLDYETFSFVPSIEDNALCMADVVSKLAEEPSINRIIFKQRRNYHYDASQIALLKQVASMYNHFVKTKKFLLRLEGSPYLKEKRGTIQGLINLLRGDPIGAYVEANRFLREEKIINRKLIDKTDIEASNYYISLLSEFKILLEKTRIISSVKPFLSGYRLGDRTIYKKLFSPDITPDFIFTRLMSRVPVNGTELDRYMIDGNTDVTIFERPDDIKYLYFLSPPEFKISEDKYELLDMAKKVLIEHKPKSEEFVDPEKMRATFFNIGKDMLQELAERQGLQLSFDEIKELTSILVRNTVGFGVLEVLLKDEKIQDITVNGPIGQTPIFIVHQDYDECVTNLIPSAEDAESWATKFRLISGRPLDEANPVLDTELIVPGARARVAIVSRPLNPWGLAYALRRHRDRPWTFPLFIRNRMISPLASGLMSFLIDGSRTLLVAGTRSSGKCVKGDTLIQLSNGDIIPIEKMMNGIEKNVDGDFIYTDENSPKIISLDNYKLKAKKLSTYWKRNIKGRKLIKIKTRSGREIVTTGEHPYFTFDKGIKSIFAGALKNGQFIATPRRINIIGNNGKKHLIDFKSPDGFVEEKDSFLIEGVTNSNSVKFPKFMDEDFAEFLGYLLGDGHIDGHKIEFTNSNEFLRNRFKKLASNFGLPCREIKSKNTCNVQITSRLLNRALSETFEIPLGRKACSIKIPREILISEKKILSSFIRAYADCDGSIFIRSRDMEICTKSEIMSKQLQMVFLRYGIVSFCKRKVIDGQSYYRILIRGEFVDRYAEFIGFNHPSKSERLKEICKIHWMENTNVDVIPQGDFYLRELRKKLRIIPKQQRITLGNDYWAYENKEYRVSRNWFKKLVNFYRERYEYLSSLSWKFNQLTNLTELYNDYHKSMFLFDEIKKLLGVSYVELSSYTNFTESWLREILQKKKFANLENLNSMAGAYGFLQKKFLKLKEFTDFKCSIETLNYWVENTSLTYAEISKATGISESMLKYYSYYEFSAPAGKRDLIVNYLEQFKRRLIINLNKSEECLDGLAKCFNEKLVSYAHIGMILGELRNELNIQDKELVNENLSIGTVSNFFNARFKNFELISLSEIAKGMIEIYNEAISDETRKILACAVSLSRSDIFWDEVLSVEEIEPDEDWVYDLTVPGAHNFIANGIIAHNTSFLGSMLVEVMRKYRIITTEDTLELPVDSLRELGYNIQPMKVRSAITGRETEMEASEGIRTSLRMGDSALILGEIRSEEAKALYEAMRVGALANVVAGTIHGDSPYGVYDRVVNDLKVPKTSFKATDIIIVCNPVKSPDGLHKWRRVMQITEVRKRWEDDPLRENGFVDLMKYDTREDTLKPTEDLLNGNSEIIKSIASNVGEWVGNWDAVWDNIILRAKIKESLVNYADKTKNYDILEARFSINANDQFHRISDVIKREVGVLEPRRIFFEWEEWLKKMIKMKRV